MDFKNFKAAVATQFKKMGDSGNLFRVDVGRNTLWELYLSSFPAGSDPIFKVKTEHDCNCCKQFIRDMGAVVSVKGAELVSIWDIKIPNEPEYQIVADALAAAVRKSVISEPFFHHSDTAGTDKSLTMLDGGTYTHNHFFVNIPRKFVKKMSDIPTLVGDYATTVAMFNRALADIDMDTLETVQELIAQNSIYRGNEHSAVIAEFKKLKKAHLNLKSEIEKSIFTWNAPTQSFGGCLRIRNTSIGKLLIDIASGADLEGSVKSFEAMVAPSNYKRPTALVTAKMIENAKVKIAELGFESALQRRYAELTDISINDIIFADRGIVKKLDGGDDVFAQLTESVAKPVKFDKVETISIDKFIENVLPTATGLEVYFENSHVNKMVSLVAPVDPTAKKMFKWDNNFSWSYVGDMTDTIKERVKAAGGDVTGELCCRLAWYNYDDLDLHMFEPNSGHISFRSRKSSSGGELDVDMNAGGGITRIPVENIFYRKISDMPVGSYNLEVNQYSSRETKNNTFDVQIDILGEVYSFSHTSPRTSQSSVKIATITKHKDGTVTVDGANGAARSTKTQDVWGIKTNNFYRCNVVMNSPNAWGDKVVGNKHYFFMIDGCVNEENARGFYNEFLSAELDPHRKVMEIVGGKMRTLETENQLSGLGFSDTGKNAIMVKVHGKTTRVLKVEI